MNHNIGTNGPSPDNAFLNAQRIKLQNKLTSVNATIDQFPWNDFAKAKRVALLDKIQGIDDAIMRHSVAPR